MQPIINPWIFYWAEVSEGIKTGAVILSILSLCFAVAFLVVGISTRDENDTMPPRVKTAIYLSISTIFFILIFTFTPTEKTIYKMTIASYLTEDNVAQGKEEIKELVDYIADKIEDTKNEGE